MKELLKRVTPGGEAAFPKDEFDTRVKALKRHLAENDIDLFFTSGAENIFYLCGQQTPGYYTFQCLAVPVRGRPILILRGLEAFNARANTYLSSIVGYADDANPAEAVAEVLIARGYKGKRIAVDRNAWFLTVNLHERLKRKLGPQRGRERPGGAAAPGQVEAGTRGNGSRRPDQRCRHGGPVWKWLESARTTTTWRLPSCRRASRPARSTWAWSLSSPPGCVRDTPIRPGAEGACVAATSSFSRPPAVTSAITPRSFAASPSAGYGRARGMYAVCREALDAGLAEMKPGNSCAAVHHAVQAGHRRARGERRLSQADRVQPRDLLCAGLGGGEHPQPLPGRGRTPRARYGLPHAHHPARVREVHRRGERERGDNGARPQNTEPHSRDLVEA